MITKGKSPKCVFTNYSINEMSKKIKDSMAEIDKSRDKLEELTSEKKRKRGRPSKLDLTIERVARGYDYDYENEHADDDNSQVDDTRLTSYSQEGLGSSRSGINTQLQDSVVETEESRDKPEDELKSAVLDGKKRRRGRSKSVPASINTNEQSRDKPEEELQSTVIKDGLKKRGRGRPKGSRNIVLSDDKDKEIGEEYSNDLNDSMVRRVKKRSLSKRREKSQDSVVETEKSRDEPQDELLEDNIKKIESSKESENKCRDDEGISQLDDGSIEEDKAKEAENLEDSQSVTMNEFTDELALFSFMDEKDVDNVWNDALVRIEGRIKRRKGRSKGGKNKFRGDCSDEGIGMEYSGDLNDSSCFMNDSLAGRVKMSSRRKRKVFDDQHFYNSMIENIEKKYTSISAKDDAELDLQSMQIMSNKHVVKRKRKSDIGEIAKGTIEELIQNSYRDEDVVKHRDELEQSNSDFPLASIQLHPNLSSTPKTDKTNSIERAIDHTNVRKKVLTTTTITAVLNNEAEDEIISDSMTSDENGEPLDILVPSSDSSNFIVDSYRSAIVQRCADRALWCDREYQKACLENLLQQLLSREEQAQVKAQLIARAQSTLGLPFLPTASTLIPRIIFSSDGQPNFEFTFKSQQSPLSNSECLGLSPEDTIMQLQSSIYDILTRNTLHVDLTNNQQQQAIE